MSLVPGSYLLRRRGKVNHTPWLITDEWANPVRAGDEPDLGWRVHDAGGGAVLIESLSVKKSNKARFLQARPGHADAWLAPRTARGGLKWRAHPDGAGGFLLESLSEADGPKWASLGVGEFVTLTQRPAGRSAAHEFVALPASDRQHFLDAEARGDYAFMAPFGGKPAAAKKPPKPSWAAGPRPTRSTPKKRAAGDPVALELVAALQPSFDDGAAGADCSAYDEGDHRAIVWPHNVVSLATVAASSGIVHHFGDDVKHAPPRGELARCRALAAVVVAALTGTRPFGGDLPTPFLPFYLVIGKGEAKPTELTPDVVRAAFRGTLFPDVPISVTPIGDASIAREEGNWPAFAAWAAGIAGLSGLCYVAVGYDTGQEPNLPAVFPRLVLGLTDAGSLAGACGSIVQA